MKKILKNLLACFVILLIFACAVFFIGWTQIRISPNSIGILKSKTNGIMKEPVYSGKFSWHWQFLLPTNAELKTFELKSYSIKKNVSGTLPSGDVYSSESNADFSYNFDFDYLVSVNAETVVNLMSKLIISDQDGLERYIDQSCESASKMLASAIIKKVENDVSYHPETLTQNDLFELVDFKKNFPLLEVNSVNLTNSKFPDYALYGKMRQLYLENIGKTESTTTEEKQD